MIEANHIPAQATTLPLMAAGSVRPRGCLKADRPNPGITRVEATVFSNR
jgi:hypothetical protein